MRIEVSTWPAHGIFTRSGRIFYVASERAGNLAAIDTATPQDHAHRVDRRGRHGAGPDADERWLYAAVGEERKLVKVDTATNTAIKSIPLPGIVHDTVLTLDGQFLYATLRRANQIAVVRTADDRVVTTIAQAAYPDLVVMEPSGCHAFVTNRWADVVTVIDVATHRQIKAIAVGRWPHGMALRPESAPGIGR